MAVVWQISVLHLNKRTLLSGVLLMEKPFTYDKKISSFKNLLKVVKSYHIDVCSHHEITVSIDHRNFETHTDEHGSFSLSLDFIPKGKPKISLTQTNQDLQIIQTYPIIFKDTDSSFDVISDIDDTIVYSYTASFFKRIGTIAFTTPKKRKPIEFTQGLFDIFNEQNSRVIYISKSESNLFNILTTIIEHNNLPKGQLFLTPYLKFAQLFKSKKHNFKEVNIRFILENSGDKKFVLFGDDSQKDMEVYTSIINKFPNRLLKVYIRQTKRKILPHQKNMLEKLRSTGVAVDYFKANKKIDVVNELTQLKNSIK